MHTLLQGDALTVLRGLPDRHFHTCVTSPPYFNLRDYQTGSWVGGDVACDHRKVSDASASIASSGLNSPQSSGGIGHRHEGYGSVCGKCGAVRIDQQIGLEATPEAYIGRLVEVFREVKRVLRDDGTLWLNIGDCFNNRKKLRRSSHRPGFNTRSDDEPWVDRAAKGGCRLSIDDGMLKEKDLIGIPWRLAFALQADGWYLRSDIIWHKSSCMPESVQDRPTNAHEHVFLLAKSARYYYDGDAIREPYAESSRSRYDHMMRDYDVDKHQPGVCGRPPKPDRWEMNPLGRACRNVWKLATKHFRGSHFAVMPVELAERCIKAGSSSHGCCGICGAPWQRVHRRTGVDGRSVEVAASVRYAIAEGRTLSSMAAVDDRATFVRDQIIKREVIGWQPTCQCEAEVVPCRVLDPFGGAGTTSYAAIKHGRHATMVELNAEYVEIARRRLLIVP